MPALLKFRPMTQRSIDAAIPDVRALIQATQDRLRIPGIAAGIVLDGELAWSEGFGVADLDSGRKADSKTLFRVASITKTFTGAAIMRLRDEGKLSLDDPLARHIPEFRRAKARRGSIEQVTLRRLLSHHSGLVSEAPFDYWHTLEFPTRAQVLDSLEYVEVALEPDRRWKYSNLGFGLLGEVVARVSGQPYEKYVSSTILKPLGLTSTMFELNSTARSQFATGYDPDPYSDRPVQAVHSSMAGLSAAGGLYTNVENLALWLRLQMSSSLRGLPEPADFKAAKNAVLSPDTLAEMQRPQILEADWKQGYGLPWRSSRSGDRVYVNHGGALPGHRSGLYFDPVRGFGFIFLSNLGWQNGPEDVSVPAMDAVATVLDGATRPANTFKPVPRTFARLLGSYASRNVLFTEVEWRADSLRLVCPPGVRSLHAPARLEPTSKPLEFLVVGGRGAGEIGRFRLAGRKVIAFSLGGVIYERLEPRSS